MPRGVIWHWEGHEYSFEEKGADWYWALGIIAAAAAVACILFNNFILALVVAAAAGALGLEAAKRPRAHYFAITDRGVVIDTNLHPYESMLSFTVLEYADERMPPSLSIKTKNFLASHLLIPIVGHDPQEIYDFFIAHIPEGRHDQSIFDYLIDFLRL
jgi:hypothetical protein